MVMGMPRGSRWLGILGVASSCGLNGWLLWECPRKDLELFPLVVVIVGRGNMPFQCQLHMPYVHLVQRTQKVGAHGQFELTNSFP
jgi:hypothetical protein